MLHRAEGVMSLGYRAWAHHLYGGFNPVNMSWDLWDIPVISSSQHVKDKPGLTSLRGLLFSSPSGDRSYPVRSIQLPHQSDFPLGLEGGRGFRIGV